MNKYDLGLRQLQNRNEAKEEGFGIKILDVVLIVLMIAVVFFYAGLQFGTSAGIDIGREKAISEVLDILKKGQKHQEGFMPLPSPTVDEERKIKI